MNSHLFHYYSPHSTKNLSDHQIFIISLSVHCSRIFYLSEFNFFTRNFETNVIDIQFGLKDIYFSYELTLL